MTQSHHQILARSPRDLRVRGDYLEIYIGKIVLDATVRTDDYSDEMEQLILFETIYSNLWDYRISTNQDDSLLIDSDGFQHAAYSLGFSDTIFKSKQLDEGTKITRVANEIEGKARSHGWIAFPRLKKSIVPHRLVFRIHVFDPGFTAGSVRHAETLEVIFDLSLFGRLLGGDKSPRLPTRNDF